MMSKNTARIAVIVGLPTAFRQRCPCAAGQVHAERAARARVLSVQGIGIWQDVACQTAQRRDQSARR